MQTVSSENEDPDHAWHQAHEWFTHRQSQLLSSFEQAIQLEDLPHFRALPTEVVQLLLQHELDALVSFFELSRSSTPNSAPLRIRQEHSHFVRDHLPSVPAAEQLRFLRRRQELAQQLILEDPSNGTFRPLLLLRLDIATTYERVLIQRLDIEHKQH